MSPPQIKISHSLRHLLNWIGSGLALAGILFVGFRLHSYWLELDLSKITLHGWGVVLFLAIIYGAANFLLAQAWWNLLQHFCNDGNFLNSVKIYGMSQLAKYVPGNIFHLAGRQALGMSAGIPAKALAKSMAWELFLIAGAGSLFFWLVLPRLLQYFPLPFGIILMFASFMLGMYLLRRFIGGHVAVALLWQMFFLLISASIFIALTGLISGYDKLSIQYCLIIGGTYTIAWLAGLVTPGSPAGVGIREIILLLILKGIVAEDSLLIVVLLGRIVTVTGDILFFLVTSFIPLKLYTIEK